VADFVLTALGGIIMVGFVVLWVKGILRL